MNNKFFVQENSNKKIPNMRRKSSLDSTKSSLKVKKIKMHNEFTSFVKITDNQNTKIILDFPICMSLFTNYYSVGEKGKKKSDSNKALKLSFKNLKNILFKKDKQITNELFLPKAKKLISRNSKNLFIHSFSPINSVVKSCIINHNQFSSSRNNANISLKKVKSIPLINLTKRTDNGIKFFKNYKYLNNQSISNSALEQEISAIKNLKNNSFGKINSSIGINDNKKLKLPRYFLSPKDNGGENEKIIFPTNGLDVNDKSHEINNNIINKSNLINKIGNNKLRNFNILESISSSISINKNKKIILNKKNKSNINIYKKNEQINKPKKKIKKDIKKIDAKEIKDKKEKTKIKLENSKRTYKRSPTRKQTLPINQIIKENVDNEKKEIKEKYPMNFMIEKEKLQKIKESKFYLAINNKKTNDIYENNIFLNNFNKEITKKSINNRLNTKIFLRKTVMLIKRKEKITDITMNQQNKFKKKEMSPLSETSKLKMMYTYIKALNNNKIELLKYNDTEILMKKIKYSRFKIKCNINNILKDYIFSTIDFGEVVLSNPNKHNKKKDFKKQGSFIHNIKMKNNIISLKRKNSFHPTKKIYINHDLEDAFSLKKTSNNIKKDIKIKHNPANLITIQDCILKSLPYYKEKYMKDKEQFLKKENKKNIIKKRVNFIINQLVGIYRKNFYQKIVLVLIVPISY